MKLRSLVPPIFLLALAACSSDTSRTRGGGSNNDDDSGVAKKDAGASDDDGGTHDPACADNPNGCVEHEIRSAAPVCACTHSCFAGYHWNSSSRACVPHDADGGTATTDGGGHTTDDAGSHVGHDGGMANANVGTACTDDSNCGSAGTCLTGTQPFWEVPFSGGYCTMPNCSETSPCPDGSDCFDLGDGSTSCFQSCSLNLPCPRTGYPCSQYDACLPATTSNGTSPVGGPCTANGDCAGTNATCVPEDGGDFPDGYCIILGCSQGSCPSGSDCFQIDEQGSTACIDTCGSNAECTRDGYACLDPGVCLTSCTPTSCDPGLVCGPDGVCIEAPCTANSCAQGLVCDQASGACVVDVGTQPPAPPTNCTSLPTWECTGGEGNCGAIVAFEPDTGPGYWDYPLNGETESNQYRSYARRDLMMLVKHAAAAVDCLAAGWTFGNRQPLGLGDMSEANGAIPGTSIGDPGHPEGTHVDGHDMDIAYFQIAARDNTLRPICPHMQGSNDAYHCVSAPTDFDVWRSALFIGKLHESPQLRVIGVDGKAGPPLRSAITQLCALRYLSSSACRSGGLAMTYEETDTGRGWYLFHHHHLHVSISGTGSRLVTPDWFRRCLVEDCTPTPRDFVHPQSSVPALRRLRGVHLLP